MPIEQEIILNTATFNPKVKTYIFLIVLFYLTVSFIGIPIIPFWLLGLGQWLSAKFFSTLKCQLTNKNLTFSKGVILHIEKTIPLENIQDLSFIGGPILRSFGLTMIRVETAGGGGQQQTNMMSMLGINNAEQFKADILLRREKVIREKYSLGQSSHATSSDTALLNDIKNELIEIRKVLTEKKQDAGK